MLSSHKHTAAFLEPQPAVSFFVCVFSLSHSLIFCIIGASVYNIAQNCSKGEDTPFFSILAK